MNIIPTKFEGCYQVNPLYVKDERGDFVKTYNVDKFTSCGLPTDWCEEYYSISRKNVIRGMHFQTPPHAHEKLVYCLKGRVLDVLLDLRVNLPSFGQYLSVVLESSRGQGILIPKGMAHGFLALSDDAIMAYKVTSVYKQSNDTGIHWNSFGFDWGVKLPIVSDRDSYLPDFTNFISPFF
jgi:dTDP-4-dehydrorhamnose 3,5-epimerase